MIYKLSSGYEINLDHIVAFSAIGKDYNAITPCGAYIVDSIEHEIIVAYHDGTAVDDSREMIKERMCKAKEKANIEEFFKKYSEKAESFCVKCKYGFKDPVIGLTRCLFKNECSFSLQVDNDISTMINPSKFKEKDADK